MKKKLILFIFLATIMSGCGGRVLSEPSSRIAASIQLTSAAVSQTSYPESSAVPVVSVSAEPEEIPLTAENSIFATVELANSGKALKVNGRIDGYIGDIGENQLFVKYESETERYIFLARIEGNQYLKQAQVRVPYLVTTRIICDRILVLCRSCYYVFDKNLANCRKYEFPIVIDQQLYVKTYDVSDDLKKIVYRDPNQDLLIYDTETKEKKIILRFTDYVHDIQNAGCSCFESPRFVAGDRKISVCFIHYADTMDVLLYDLFDGQTVSTYVGSSAPSSGIKSSRGFAWLGRNKEHDTQTVSFFNYETGKVSSFDTGYPWNSMPPSDNATGFIGINYAAVTVINQFEANSSRPKKNRVYWIDLSTAEFRPQPLELDTEGRVALRYIFDNGQICYIAMTEDGNFGDYYITR